MSISLIWHIHEKKNASVPPEMTDSKAGFHLGKKMPLWLVAVDYEHPEMLTNIEVSGDQLLVMWPFRS